MAGKFALTLVCFLAFATLAVAQVPNGNVFFGYSYYHTNLSSIDSANANGWETSVEGKIIPFLGFVADVDSHYGSANSLCTELPAPACLVSVPSPGGGAPLNDGFTEYNFLFGPRVSISVSKFRPFAEALFGGERVRFNSVVGNGGGSDTSFATAVGGGLDYKIIRPIAWRFQGDYVQTRFFDATQNNIRISTGLVLRF